MKLTIVIVNYKTAALLLDCLASVYAFDTGDLELVVVDNASEDDSEALVRAQYPAVHFIQMGYNAGFARANNRGIAAASGDVILLLNSDTINRGNAINTCFSNLVASEYVAAGVQLLNADGSPQVSGNFVMTGGLNHLLPLPYIGKFFKGIAGLLSLKKTNIPNATGLVEVDWINGAFLMVKKQAIATAGLLDEDFFLYYEEAEWCSRLRKTGKLCIYGDLHVIHLQGESAGAAFNSAGKGYVNLFDKKGYQLMLSCLLRIRKEFGPAWLFFHLLVYAINIPVFFIGIWISSLFNGKQKTYSFAEWVGFCHNYFRVVGYVPGMLSGRPHFYKVL